MNIEVWKLLVIWCLVFVFSGMLGSPALAHTGANNFWTPGEPIVQCGGVLGACRGGVCSNGVGPCQTSSDCGVQPDCTKCDIFHLVRHIVDFILVAATPILAVLFFIVAGVYIMLGGTNPGMLATGKRIFRDTFIGVLIVMLAWLITNTLIRSLVDPSAIQGTNWYEFQCPFQ